MSFPKGTATADRKARKAASIRYDRAQSALALERSEGRCEAVVETVGEAVDFDTVIATWRERCGKPAIHCHHLIFGNGKRGRGPSAEMDAKQILCDVCHSLVHGVGGKLERIGDAQPRWTDVYRRVR